MTRIGLIEKNGKGSRRRINMGCFDTIMVHMDCLICKRFHVFEAQTKDMDSCMWTYHALRKNWFDKPKKDDWNDRTFRKGLPTFKQYPYQKGFDIWKNQAERMEASARVEPIWGKQLRYVTVICSCDEGKKSKFFDGKIAIEKHGRCYYLIGKIYDIVFDK